METPYGELKPPRGPRIERPVIALALVAGLAVLTTLLWRAGVWSPRQANGGQPGATHAQPSYKSIAASLEAAQTYLKLRDLAKAEAVLRESVRRFSEDQELRVLYAQTLMEMKKPGEAYEQYVAALTIGPRTHELEFAAGTMANMSGQPGRAVEHYSAAQAAQPANAAYALYLAQVQRKTGETQAAKANLLMAANLQPDDATAWGTLADIALQENNIEIALQHLKKARELQPDVTAWRLIEARALKRKGDPETALIVLLAINDAERSQTPILRLIAESYGMLDRSADAAATYAEASDANPTDKDLAYEAGVWFARADQKDKARAYGTRAMRLGHEHAVKLLEKLGK